MLATVRRPNRACSFPAHGFHDSAVEDAEGDPTRFTSPYSPGVAVGDSFPATEFTPALHDRCRPDASHDPSVGRMVEELSDVGIYAKYSPQPLRRVQRALINCSVARGTRRFVRCRIIF